MTENLRVGEIVALLFDECRYNELRPKALHKILYFTEQELEREHVPADLPTFWYMYGAMVATSGTEVTIEEGEGSNLVECSVELSDIDAPDSTIRRVRKAAGRALEPYYEKGIEGLTDEMYKEAPYEVQRNYRILDQQLDAAADAGQMTLDGGKNEQRTRETVYDFVESFPEEEFPEYTDDLSIWYRLMSTELDSDDYDPDRAQRLAREFWRLFCLELACRENNGLSRTEIAEELLGVDNIEQAKAEIRGSLLKKERRKAQNNARGDETALKAAEAFVIPYLDVKVTSEV